MSLESHFVNVVINPPRGEQLEPGTTEQIRVVITNQSADAMVMEVELDLPPLIRDWCKVTRASFNLDSGRSEEVVFNWAIPIEALADIYDYDIVVDCRDRFPAPLRYTRQLKIITPVVRQASSKDPTFTIKPVTTSIKPIVWQWGQNINVTAIVHNRSNIVDDFRLSCDLNDDWYSVRYPEGIETVGLISSGNKLSLNPNTKGQIILCLNPPPETLAGNYQPTINIHSAVNKDLFLQDIFYLRIPAVHNLHVELQTIRNKVKQKSAIYNIQFKNDGNTIRVVTIQAYTADEEEFGEYELERKEVRIPPGKTVDVGLKVALKQKRQRSFLRAKKLNFLVQIEDKENNPLPKYLPLKATLDWQARPLWQLILLIVLILAGVTGTVFLIIWLINLNRAVIKPEIARADTEDKIYDYGERITLNWQIKNADKLESVTFSTDKNSPGGAIERKYNKSELLNSAGQNILNRYDCNLDAGKNILECVGVNTGASEVGDYTFNLQVYSDKDSDKPSDTQEIKATIKAPPKPAVEDIKVARTKYEPNEKIDLQFEINQPDLVSTIDIISSDRFKILGSQDTSAKDEHTIAIEQLKERKYCKAKASQKDRLECSVPVTFPNRGNYSFTIRLTSNYPPYNQPESISAQIAKPIAVSVRLEIVDFTINGVSNGPILIERDEPIMVSWEVNGEDVRVAITDSGRTYGSKDSVTLGPYRPGTNRNIILTATDKDGNSEQRNIEIQVRSLPNPERRRQRIILPDER